MTKGVVAGIFAAAMFITYQGQRPAGGSEKQATMENIPKNIRPYFVCFLVKKEGASDLPEDLFKKHLAYIRAQVEAKKYVLVGPFTDDGRVVGMSVIDAKTLEEARVIASGDPTVQAGLRSIEIHSALFTEIIPNAKF